MKDPELYTAYHEFMDKYTQLEHMEPATVRASISYLITQ